MSLGREEEQHAFLHPSRLWLSCALLMVENTHQDNNQANVTKKKHKGGINKKIYQYLGRKS
jgi:hypothetical protein